MLKKDKDSNIWKSYLRYSSLGLEMGLSVVAGIVIGKWFDQTFGTEPYFLVFWLIAGLGAAFRPIFRLIQQHKNFTNE